MPLTDKEILEEMQTKRLIIHPILSLGQINGCKIDLRLGNSIDKLKRSERPVFNARSNNSSEVELGEESSLTMKEAGYILHPGDFALAPLFERIKMPGDLMGRLDGRSSLGRLGIIIHATAGIIDPGFSGRLILELSNAGTIPVALFPLMRIASITFERLSSPVERIYSKISRSKYKQRLYTKLASDYEFGDGVLDSLEAGI